MAASPRPAVGGGSPAPGPLRVRVLTWEGPPGTPVDRRLSPGELGLQLDRLPRGARASLGPGRPAPLPHLRVLPRGARSLTLLGSAETLRSLPGAWERAPRPLALLAGPVGRALANFFSEAPRPWRLAHGRALTVGAVPRIMGVVNVTPDSFFDGGRLRSPDEAAAYARLLASQGADLLDVGGESTRPGARPLSPSQELRRVLPVVERLARTSETLLSVDTRHAEVARQALRAGAHVVNDVGGFRDPALRRVVRREEAGAVVMHMRGTPRTMQRDVRYRDLRAEVYAFLEDRTRLAEDEGIPPEALVVDPGLGFGKSFPGTWELLGHVREFRALGYPVLVGASRKGFLGALLGGAPPAERLEVSVAAALLAVERGAAVVRVHDVGPTARALRVLRALRPGPAGAGPSGVGGSGAGSSGASKGPARAGSPARGPPSPRRPRPGRPGPGPGSRSPREAP